MAAKSFTRDSKGVVQKADQDDDHDVHQNHENSEPDGQDKFRDVVRAKNTILNPDKIPGPCQFRKKLEIKIDGLSSYGMPGPKSQSPPRKAKKLSNCKSDGDQNLPWVLRAQE